MKKILIIDNNPVILKLLSSTLENEGYDVLTACDGLTAFDILQHHVPDIIFLDLIMPNINGEQLSRMMCDMESLQNTPVILISGVAAEAGKHCDLKGIDGCIAKGPNLKTFVLEIVRKLDSGSYKTTAEVTGRDEVYPREVSQELLATNHHLKVVLQNMNDGMVEITRDNRVIFANRAISDLIGLPEEKLLAIDFTELFQRDDKQRLCEILKNVTDAPVTTEQNETLLLNKKHVTLQLIPISSRETHSIIVILRDMTEKVEAENELREIKNYLASVLASVQAGIFIVDAETRTIIDANPVALEMFGLEKKELLGRRCYDFACPKAPGDCPILDNDEVRYKTVQTLVGRNGSDLFVHKTATSCKINNKKYIVESLVDITEQKVLEEKLRTQSITDDMTGLLNRRGFFMMAKKQLKIADRSQKPLYLLFADVDNLKWINDTFGHEAGDKILVQASKILSSVRSSDIVGRLGGDEFAILVVGNEDSESKAHIEKRFGDLLEQANTQCDDRFSLSISYGVVRYDPASPSSIEELLSQGDKLMYASKNEKRSV